MKNLLYHHREEEGKECSKQKSQVSGEERHAQALMHTSMEVLQWQITEATVFSIPSEIQSVVISSVGKVEAVAGPEKWSLPSGMLCSGEQHSWLR